MNNHIIVYSNPIEAAFWTSEFTFPIMCAIILAVVVSMLCHNLLDRPKIARWYADRIGENKISYYVYKKLISKIALSIAIVTFLTTLYVMI